MKATKTMFGFFLLVISVLSGCHELGHEGFGGYGRPRDSLRGTVQRNDPRYSSILFETDDRRGVSFYHNDRTLVRYRDRDYPVQNIQSGDYIEIRARDITATNPTADIITVISLANSAGGIGRVETLEGRVESINARGGSFEMRSVNNRVVVVILPTNPTRVVSDRFNRLRNGDRVRIEGRFTQQNRFELITFL